MNVVFIVWLKHSREITTKVYMCLVTCDSVARPLLQNSKQFNGEYGCSFCLLKGSVVQKGLGYARSYASTVTDFPEQRTHEQTLQHAETAVQNNSVVFGIKGPSILSLVPKFDMVRGFVPEYMHSVLLGVVRQFVYLWFDTSSSGKQYYLGRHVNVLDAALQTIKPPCSIKCLPRLLSSRKYWKASEWRNFFLFYSPILLRSVLPKAFSSTGIC